MKLAGITSLDQATPGLVNTMDVDYLVSSDDFGVSDATPKARLSKL